MSNSFRDIQ